MVHHSTDMSLEGIYMLFGKPNILKELEYEFENGHVVITGYLSSKKLSHMEIVYGEMRKLNPKWQGSIEIPGQIEGKPVTAIEMRGFQTLPAGHVSGKDLQSCGIGRDSLQNITLPASLSRIGTSAFAGCVNLNSISIPENVLSIGPYSFHSCRKLDSVAIPDQVNDISDYSFCGCSGIKEISFGKGLKSIGVLSFAYCRSLISAALPEGMKTIKKRAFLRCPGIKTVFLPGSLTELGEGVFAECGSLRDVFFAGSEEQWAELTGEKDIGLGPEAAVHFGRN